MNTTTFTLLIGTLILGQIVGFVAWGLSRQRARYRALERQGAEVGALDPSAGTAADQTFDTCKEVLPFLGLFGSLLVAAAITDALLHLLDLVWVGRCLGIPGTLLILLSLLAIVYPHLMVEPGKLINAHASLETDCFACHTPFIGSQPAKCVQCHTPAEIGLVTTKGLSIAHERKLTPFHQDVIEQDCVACHSDHKGVQSFRPIGQFSHGLLQVNLRGECNGCHRNPGDSLHRSLVANCSQCHSQQAWTPATLDHEPFFRFDEDHQTACATCHVEQDYSRYTCYGCHEHSRSNICAEHVEEGIEDYENCVECHRSGDAEEGEGGEGGEGDDHGGRNADIGTLRSQTRQDLWERSRGERDQHDDHKGREDDD